jgi:RNA polymerase sigma-70 factor, ECF subfamily
LSGPTKLRDQRVWPSNLDRLAELPKITTCYHWSIADHERATPCIHLCIDEQPACARLELRRGDALSDFAQLLENQIPRLRRYARALTRDATRADDLVQSCLERALARRNLWQPGTDLRAWLFTILHNQHVNEVRSSLREDGGIAAEASRAIPTVDPNALASLQLQELYRAVGSLPAGQRQVILLVGLEGMRYEEVAKILDIPVGTVRSRLSRGRQELRKMLEEGLPQPTRGRSAAVSARQAA